MEDDLRFPAGYSEDNILAHGISGLILLDESSQTVIKSPIVQDDADINVERRIYERFEERGGHENILRYLGPYERGIRLEFMPNYNFLGYITANKVVYEQKIRWAQQIISALCFVHAAGVVHGDLNIFNILLDANLDAKLADFAGSSLDGSPLLVVVTESHRRPGDTCCTKADIFAFGSTLYTIITGQSPYHNLADYQIDKCFKNANFPQTNSLGPLGDIIFKCWHDKYSDAKSVYREIKAISDSRVAPARSYSMAPVQLSVVFAFVGIAVILGRKLV